MGSEGSEGCWLNEVGLEQGLHVDEITRTQLKLKHKPSPRARIAVLELR